MTRRKWLRRLMLPVTLGVLLAGAVRYVAVSPDAPIEYCVNWACGDEQPLLASLLPERPMALAAVRMASWLGMVPPSELGRIGPAFEARYDELDALVPVSHVNALLLRSSSDRVEGLLSRPVATGSAPGVVFLHGYGGLISPYVSNLRRCSALDGYAILAPALSLGGDWWSDEGLAVVRRTLATMPSTVDATRLALVGLSNGAVGATEIASHAELASRFRAIVALEGIGHPRRHSPPVRPLTVIATRDDTRFPIDFVEAAAGDFRLSGASIRVRVVPGDHLAFFDSLDPICLELERSLRDVL